MALSAPICFTSSSDLWEKMPRLQRSRKKFYWSGGDISRVIEARFVVQWQLIRYYLTECFKNQEVGLPQNHQIDL